MKRNRFYVENEGQQLSPIVEALKYVDNDNRYDKIYLVIFAKSFKYNLVDIGLIKNTDTCKIEFDNSSCEIITLKKLLENPHLENTLIISTWIDSENLFKIEEIAGIKTIIAIPWLKSHLKLWKLTYSPISLINK